MLVPTLVFLASFAVNINTNPLVHDGNARRVENAIDAPAADVPAADAPAANAPAADAPAADAPAADAPAADAPAADAPAADAPAANAPAADAPAADAPAADAPDAKAPDANAPDANAPDANAPDANTPDPNAPDASAPDGSTPDGNTPDADAPDGGSGGGDHSSVELAMLTVGPDDMTPENVVTDHFGNPRVTSSVLNFSFLNGGVVNLLTESFRTYYTKPATCLCVSRAPLTPLKLYGNLHFKYIKSKPPGYVTKPTESTSTVCPPCDCTNCKPGPSLGYDYNFK